VILGTARAIGETAPVLLTAGSTFHLNTNPLSGPMMSLPLLAYQSAANAFPAVQARGFGAAVTLLALVLVLFVAARKIGGRGPGQLSAGQRRRVAAASRRDLARYARHNAAYTDAAVFGYSQERT
jgi:phosphate transport system permease protein